MVSRTITQTIFEPATPTGLPEFFQTDGPIMEEYLEEVSDDSRNTQNVVSNPPYQVPYTPIWGEFVQEQTNQEEGAVPDDENATYELLDFFHGVPYEDMEEMFRSFEYGNTWISNPIFTDEFAFCALPKRLSNIVYELHSILQIQRVVPADWNRNDARYSSLSVPQQTHLRELIHANPVQHARLDDVYNRLKGYKQRTPYPQIKFLIIKTMNVVQDILRKENSEYEY